MTPTERAATRHGIVPAGMRPPCRIEQAYLALMRGSMLLGRVSGRADAVLRDDARLRARVLMNRLRELDRLTAILLNEIAGSAGLDAAQTATVRRRRSVAAKLGAVRALLALDDSDEARLDAIRDARRRLARGHNPPASARDLAAIYRFYGELADRLFARRPAMSIAVAA
jgi:hypothetical protein